MRKTVMLFVMLAVLGVSVVVSPALAINPDEALKDPVLETRARTITREVRCLVCQGESIDESNAPLAADLRKLVRARLMAGDSDDDVRAYLVRRYGEYVLMRPPLGLHTLLLWGLPFAMLGGALYIVARQRRCHGRVEETSC